MVEKCLKSNTPVLSTDAKMKIGNFIQRPLIHKYTMLLLFVFIYTSCNHSTHNRQASVNDKKNVTNMIPLVQNEDAQWWKKEADKMVNNQIVARGINDKRLISVMKNTPRHLFIPESIVNAAYNDSPLPIGEGQTISQPYIVALMTELLDLTGNEIVLEIGTGSGYQAAVLSQLVDTCYSIELLKKLADSASSLLKQLGYNNVVVKCDDGYKGWAEHAPFDCIIITAAPEEVPDKLIDQLKINGRMVVPVGKYNQNLLLVTKTEKGIIRKNITAVRFVPMVKPE